MKLKKIIITLSYLLSTSVFAYGIPYIGADVGADFANWSGSDLLANKQDYSNTGVIGDLFIGYGFYSNLFYLGIEGFINGTSNKSAKVNINGGLTQREINRIYGYGASLLPGIRIADFIVYVRGGYYYGRYNVEDKFVNANTSKPLITGTAVGFGVEKPFWHHLDLRADYTYVNYHSYNNLNGYFTPRENQLTIGVIYRFLENTYEG